MVWVSWKHNFLIDDNRHSFKKKYEINLDTFYNFHSKIDVVDEIISQLEDMKWPIVLECVQRSKIVLHGNKPNHDYIIPPTYSLCFEFGVFHKRHWQYREWGRSPWPKLPMDSCQRRGGGCLKIKKYHHLLWTVPFLAWPALQICTVFNCVPLSTVISLYSLHLIALYSPMWKLQ